MRTSTVIYAVFGSLLLCWYAFAAPSSTLFTSSSSTVNARRSGGRYIISHGGYGYGK